jgi:hypothetical protein
MSIIQSDRLISTQQADMKKKCDSYWEKLISFRKSYLTHLSYEVQIGGISIFLKADHAEKETGTWHLLLLFETGFRVVNN